MAHGDYHCCAICDCKITYGGLNATTKKKICSECVANLAQEGIIVHNVDELLKWIGDTPIKEVKSILKKVGFYFCFYPNVVDQTLIEKGVVEGEDGKIQ